MVDLYGIHVGKYTVRPMDHMGHKLDPLTISGFWLHFWRLI